MPRNLILDPRGTMRLLVGIDHGTKFSSITFGERELDSVQTSLFGVEPEDWVLNNQDSRRICMDVGFGYEGGRCRMYMGPDLQFAIASGDVESFNVIQALKLAILFKNGASTSSAMEEGLGLGELKSQVDAVLHRMDLPTDIYFSLPYGPTEEASTHKVGSAEDILHMCQLYLYSLLKDSYRQKTCYSYAEIDFTFAKKALIAISVPSCWSNRTIDRCRKAWNKVGISDKMVVLAEAKSVAVCSAFRSVRRAMNRVKSDQLGTEYERRIRLPKTLTTIVDIGGGATDVAVVTVYAKDGLPKVGELVDSAGSHSGCFRLVQIFRSNVRDVEKNRIECLMHQTGCTEDEVLDAFCQGFEMAKLAGRSYRDLAVPFTLFQKPGSRLGKTFLPKGKLIRSSVTVRTIWDWCFDELSIPVGAQIEATRDVQDDFAYKNIALAGGGSFSELIRPRFEQKYEVEGWKVLTVEEANHSAVAEGNFLSLFDPDNRNQSFARAMYGLCATGPYNPKSKMHQGRLQEAQPSEHYEGEDREDSRERPIWMIYKGDELKNSVLCGTITIEDPSAQEVILERKVIWTEDSVLCREKDDSIDVQEWEENGVVKSRLLRINVGSIRDLGVDLCGSGNAGYYAETEFKVYVKPMGVEIWFVFVVPNGGAFPNEEDHSEPEEGYFREVYKTCAKVAHAAREGDEDVRVTG